MSSLKQFGFWDCFDFYLFLFPYRSLSWYIVNIIMKKYIQSIRKSDERGNTAENPGIMQIKNKLRS